ncbi:hypothetical protein ETAA8_35750 [Anatilimnocola aggregata]|uniref:Uncharacterized protein n=1 Tax=Anatilimnocola aggregata TaxID=2528021 RepID=A0A517YE10_9BACT|nr:hypothetical protein [Anatilimnocola aggregata]QDU28474.1 hypothetical protein ETAA8_35750 [Anatilimnocola aggregata]
MVQAAATISGLIEFEPAEARANLYLRQGSDDTLSSTLLSLAHELLSDTADHPNCGWLSETEIVADTQSLERDLLVIYHRVQRRAN